MISSIPLCYDTVYIKCLYTGYKHFIITSMFFFWRIKCFVVLFITFALLLFPIVGGVEDKTFLTLGGFFVALFGLFGPIPISAWLMVCIETHHLSNSIFCFYFGYVSSLNIQCSRNCF